jgi:hypothetical protein
MDGLGAESLRGSIYLHLHVSHAEQVAKQMHDGGFEDMYAGPH